MTEPEVKISRVKLIERLKAARAAEQEKAQARVHERILARLDELKRYVDRHGERAETIKNPYFGDLTADTQLDKTIRLLEMSEEPTITVLASSDIYKYLVPVEIDLKGLEWQRRRQ